MQGEVTRKVVLYQSGSLSYYGTTASFELNKDMFTYIMQDLNHLKRLPKFCAQVKIVGGCMNKGFIFNF